MLIEITQELGGFDGVSEHTEGNIVVSSMLRIMTQIVVRVPNTQLNSEARAFVVETGL